MSATYFLVETVFNLYLMVVLLRIWLQMARADFYNPFSQFVVKATNPLLIPLRRIIPGFGGLDLAGILLALVITMAKLSVLQILQGKGFPPVLGLLIAGAFDMLKQIFSLMFWILIIRALLSWISQGYNPFEAVLHQLTEPMLAPIRRILPPMGGLDLSILVLIIGLQFVQLLIGDFVSML